ncbi:hypothetical protein M2260_003318 [Rhodococcus erythropolis]|nr:hypothetical protein [Rhodococcus erythropolis]
MSAFSASSALVLRTCKATLAGFFSTVAPGVSAAIRPNSVTISSSSFLASASIA